MSPFFFFETFIQPSNDILSVDIGNKVTEGQSHFRL